MNGPETDLDAAIAASAQSKDGLRRPVKILGQLAGAADWLGASGMDDMLDAAQAHAAGPAPGLGAGMQHVQPIQQSTADNQEPARKRQKRNDDEAAAAPLLQQLRYGQVIKKIAEIRKLTTEDKITKFGHRMVLPRIIVIGNESSGKSSTLERIAGQPVLPCDTGICTRAPVVLELKYDPTVLDAEIYFRGFTGEYERMKDAEHARTKVQAAMDSLKDVGVASDKEVRVKIVSQDVPTLDLVDLPGIVLARNNAQGSENEPDCITQHTVECTTRFLASADTAVVLCIVASADIVSAAEPNLRTVNRVKALGLLQESSITTSSRTR